MSIGARTRFDAAGAVCLRARPWDTSAGGLAGHLRPDRFITCANSSFGLRFSRTRRAHRRGWYFHFHFKPEMTRVAMGAMKPPPAGVAVEAARAENWAPMSRPSERSRRCRASTSPARLRGSSPKSRFRNGQDVEKGALLVKLDDFHRTGRSARQYGADEKRPKPSTASRRWRRAASRRDPISTSPRLSAIRPPAPRTRPAP